MVKLTFTPFHERSLSGKSEFLEEKVRAVEQANLEKGSFIMYKNELCSAPDLFINEYANRKELVRVNAISGKISLVKRIA